MYARDGRPVSAPARAAADVGDALSEPIDWGGLRLTTFPAGHCLGSAMLLAEDGRQSLLYTGDFKLGESATAAQAELPHADILVIESTYGHPDYRLPPRQQVLDELLALVRHTLADDAVPVIQAYALGKGQEVTRLLTDAGIPVLQHRHVFAVSQVYEACGMSLGRYERLTAMRKARLGGRRAAGHAAKGDSPVCRNGPRVLAQMGLSPFPAARSASP